MIDIPYIEGDGIGPEVVNTTINVLNSVVNNLNWISISYNDYDTIRRCGVALKGPLGTPVGEGHRSYNVQMRQDLDLYSCIRPLKWYGLETPTKHPERVDIVVFRENTEDVYAGHEFKEGTYEAIDICFANNIKYRSSTAVGLKIISEEGSKRLMKMACEWSIKNNRSHITIVHKGNIMKWTEGGFRRWCYEIAREYPQLKVDDCICDAFFQNSLIHPENYDVVVTTNLNGDYISDAIAAQVGGIGISPGVNMNDSCAVFEATHGTAPDIAGKGIANPCSCVLSGAMLLDYLGFSKEADTIRIAISKICQSGIIPVTTEEWENRIISLCKESK